MADTPEELARAAASVYYDAERRLVESISKRVSQGLEVGDWQRQALGNAQRLTAESRKTLQGLGLGDQWADLVGKAYDEGQGVTSLPGQVPSTQKRKAVAGIANELHGLTQGLNTQVLRRVDDAYRQVIGEVTAATAARGISRRDAAAEAMARLGKQGLGGFQDQSGRNWRLGDYVDMATRTGLQRAQIGGHEQALKDAGLDLVIVQPGPRACPICDDWARAILSMSGQVGRLTVENVATGKSMQVTVDGTLDDARRAGFQHPNCRCAIRAYLPGVTKAETIQRPPYDAEGYRAQQQQRTLEKRVREAQMAQAAAIDPKSLAKARARERAARASLNGHLKANPQLKRQTGRTSIGGQFATDAERAGPAVRRQGGQEPTGAGLVPLSSEQARLEADLAPPLVAPKDTGRAISATRQQLREAKTVDEMKAVVAQRFPDMELVGFTSRTLAGHEVAARAHLDKAIELFDRFAVEGPVRAIQFRNITSGRKGQAAAWVESNVQTGESALAFNVNAFNLITPEALAKMKASSWWRMDEATDAASHVVTHEFAHIIEHQLSTKIGMAAVQRQVIDTVNTVLGTSYKSASGALKAATTRGELSRYGSSAWYEALAEAFATVEESPGIASATERALHAIVVQALGKD